MKSLEIGNSRLGKSSSRCPIQDKVRLCLPCLQAVIYPSLNETRFQRIFDLETINFKNLSTLRMTRNYRAKKPLNNQTPTRASNAAKKYHSFLRDKPCFFKSQALVKFRSTCNDTRGARRIQAHARISERRQIREFRCSPREACPASLAPCDRSHLY